MKLFTIILILTATLVMADKKPNVLLIIIDDLRDSLKCYGSKHIHSPAIDSLAEKGTLFTKAYCQYALCGPSRASFFTSSYPQTTRVFKNSSYFRDSNPDAVTIPGHFMKHDYSTHGIGKILHDTKADSKSWTLPRLFEKGKVYAGKGFKDKVALIDGIHKENRNMPLFEGPDVPDNAYRDGVATEDAVKAIRTAAKESTPFFLMVGYHKPHSPFNAPKKYWDLYDPAEFKLAPYQEAPAGVPISFMKTSRYLRSFKDMPEKGILPEAKQRQLLHAYYACVSYIDAQVAILLAELKKQNLDNNTIVAVTSDHGYQLGEHGLWCKHTNFEDATKVPLIVMDPRLEKKNQGRKVNEIVELIDVGPTLWEICGLPKVASVDGKSFKQLLTGSSNDFKVARSRMGNGVTVRNDEYRYIRWKNRKTGKVILEELYDYRRDPDERRNQAVNPEYKEQLDKMRNLMDEQLKTGF